MSWQIVKKDFKRNKVINLAVFLFILFSACLAVLSVVMAVQTFTSISELYAKAQPPHFLQMHKGEFDQKKIDSFMSTYKGVTFWQTDTMIDVYGENLTVSGEKGMYNLSDCRIDIGMVKQNDSKDLLLNSLHEKVLVQSGQIGIPVLLRDMYDIKIGDRITLNCNNVTKEFVVKEFVLDSMMNSSMCSSTRILLSDEDYEKLINKVGEKEYIIEAYFHNSKEASAFQTAYENAVLPQNGQAITYTMMFLLSAITDVFMVFVLLLASIFMIIVSFICVKFTILAALQEEVGEIGTMKAIGLPFSDIRELYLNKYRILSFAGVLSGYVLALLISNVFTKHINTTFGKVGIPVMAVILSLVAALLVYLLIHYYCKRILKKIKKVTVVDALVRGKGFEKEKDGIKGGLYKSRLLSVNWLMGLREISYRFRNWIIIFAVVLIVVIMIMIPINLIHTIENPEFITYMGSSKEDILIEIEDGNRLNRSYSKAAQVLKQDTAVKSYKEYRRVLVQSKDAEDELMNIHIDCGESAGIGLKYQSGKAPENDNEIAVSFLNATALGKKPGDSIILFFHNKKKEMVISGIYQDVTSGGYTAKSNYGFTELRAKKYSFTVNLINPAGAQEKADEWTKILGAGITVDPMDNLIDQTLGGVVKQLKSIVFFIILLGSCLVILITALFLRLRLAKDLSEIAVLKAIGFSVWDIKKQYLIKTGGVSLVSILLGTIVTNMLGDKITDFALGMTGLGIKQVELIVNPVTQYILCPLLLMALILLVTWTVVRTIERYNIISMIKE